MFLAEMFIIKIDEIFMNVFKLSHLTLTEKDQQHVVQRPFNFTKNTFQNFFPFSSGDFWICDEIIKLRHIMYAFYNFVEILLKDRKSTRLNSSHVSISYAVFCLKKK